MTRRSNEYPSSGISKYAQIKTNIIACFECGSYHQIGRLCSTCYDKVRSETIKMMKEFRSNKPEGVDPAKEVAFVYNNESPNEEVTKDKFVVKVAGDRPKWFDNNLYTKVTTKK